MKVLLVKPYNIGDHIQPSLGLLYLAGQIRKNHDVAIHDCIKFKTPVEQIDAIVRRHNPDIIGVQCYTFDVPNVYKMLQRLKEIFPDKTTVVGGAHISAIPVEAFNQLSPYADFGFKGEAEIGFPKLLDLLESQALLKRKGQHAESELAAVASSLEGFPRENLSIDEKGKNTSDQVPGEEGQDNREEDYSRIEGLIWRNKKGRVIVNDPVFVEDLDALGFPAWDLMPPETYPESQHGAFYKKFPIAPIIITRGCPYQCTFCSAPILSGRRIRRHSVEYVKEHVSLLYKRGVREIHIVDDNFTFDANFCKDVLRGIIDLKLNIAIALPNGIRMDRVDDEILDLMREAGVYLLSIAFESGTDHILKKMNKATTVERMRADALKIRKHGFPLAGFFILGFPEERRGDIEATIKFSRELGLIRANYFTYLPLPGTASYNELVEFGKIEKVDWKNFYFMTAPYVPDGMSREELLALKKKAFLSFYMNPRVFIANVRGIKSFRHLKFLLRRFYHWVMMKPENPSAALSPLSFPSKN